MSAVDVGSPTLATIRHSVTASEPGWLADARRAAFEWIDANGYPTRRDEDWRYMRVGDVIGAPLVPVGSQHSSTSAGIDAEQLGRLAPDLGGARLVFVDGHLSSGLSSVTGLPDGVTITGVATMLASRPDTLATRFVSAQEEPRDGFAALNVGLAEDGAYIDIPADTAVELPIHLVFVTTDTAGEASLLSSTRSVVVAGANSRATIVETHIGTGGGAGASNAAMRVFAEAGAEIGHVITQNAPEDAFHLSVLEVAQAADSRFSSNAFSVGGAIARHEVRVRLDGERGDVSLAGLYVPHARQYHDHPVVIEHVAPNCTSRQDYHGILDDQSHGVFNGRIVVHHAGIGTDASQANKNLILSDRAEIDTRPRLEIFADDVKCAHGATVGQLDEEAVYYLRSRGIPESVARGVLTNAFAAEIVERVELGPLRTWIEDVVAARLLRAPGVEPSDVLASEVVSQEDGA